MAFSLCPLMRTRSNWRCWPSILRRRSCCSANLSIKSGDWVVQNAANSSVGRWVIAFAKARGLKTVNIVRPPELVGELETIGGDVVVVDSPDVAQQVKDAVRQVDLRLALD